MSINALPSYLLEKMGIAPTGFLAVSDAVRRKVPVLSRNRDSLPGDEGRLVEDYRLLQYDLLLGKRYSLRDGGLMSASCSGHM